MATLQAQATPTNGSHTQTFVLDTDAHNLALPADLVPYLPRKWGGYLETIGLRTIGEAAIPRARLLASRADAWSPSGRPPGSDPAFFAAQLLDTCDIKATILNNAATYFGPMVGGNQPLAFTAAFFAAINEWMAAEWLTFDERFYAGVAVPVEDPKGAVAAIERWGGEDRFVTLSLPFATQAPMGAEKYFPMLEAAARHGLPLSLHTGGIAGPPTGSGWPSFYFEDHMNRTPSALAQIASLIIEGVFDRLPELKVVVQEGGYSWFAPYGWQLDSAWRRLRDEEPFPCERAPSEYMEEHLWFSTQPMEEPGDPQHFLQSLDLLGPDRLMYSSDYPHWDFDPPTDSLPVELDPALVARILGENAAALYPALPQPPDRR
jgi:uncharacterized protein